MLKKPEKLVRREKPLGAIWREGIGNLLFYSIVIGICFIILYPVLKLFPTVFNDMGMIGGSGSIWIPEKFSLGSFRVAIYMVYGNVRNVAFSILYAAAVALIQMFMSAMIGYAIARHNFWYTKMLTFFVVLVILVPPQATLISQYLSFKKFSLFGIIPLLNGGQTIDLVNNPMVLLIINLFGFGVKQSVFAFMFRQSFKGFPSVLEEAARIDGCGYFKTYIRIAFPNAKPIIITVLTLSFVWNYGDTYYTGYFYPDGPFLAKRIGSLFQWANREMISDVANKLLGVVGDDNIILDAVKHAAALLYAVPLLIFYFIIQKKLVQNFENSGIVG